MCRLRAPVQRPVSVLSLLAGEMLRRGLPSHLEVQASSGKVHRVMGKGGFGVVVSATLTLVGGITFTTALKLMRYQLGDANLDNICAEVVLAAHLGLHPRVNSCVGWMVLGDGTNHLPLEALEPLLPCGPDDVLVVMVLSELMTQDFASYAMEALDNRFCPSHILMVSG